MDSVSTVGSGGRFVEPRVVTDHFHLRPGDKVADFGAGSGFFARELSQRVGNDGRVYACEIQKGLVEKLGAMVTEQNLSNVSPIWCDLEAQGGIKLADGVLDSGILVNTLFQLENKESALREMARVIRPGGKFFVIDWTESYGGMGPRPEDVISEDSARSMVEGVGFQFEVSFPTGAHHYGLAFRKI